MVFAVVVIAVARRRCPGDIVVGVSAACATPFEVLRHTACLVGALLVRQEDHSPGQEHPERRCHAPSVHPHHHGWNRNGYWRNVKPRGEEETRRPGDAETRSRRSIVLRRRKRGRKR